MFYIIHEKHIKISWDKENRKYNNIKDMFVLNC